MIKAFTIIELVVAMLIGAILTAIIFYTYLLFTRQYSGYQKKTATINEYILFRSAFNNDIDNSDFMQDSSGHIFFRNYRSEVAIAYSLEGDKVIRTAENISDSFFIKTTDYEAEMLNGSLSLVKEVVFTVNIDSQLLKPVFTKMYSAQQIMCFENEKHEQ